MNRTVIAALGIASVMLSGCAAGSSIESLLSPPVLYSGDHGKVDQWRYEHSLINTAVKRPDMLEKKDLSQRDREILHRYFNRDKAE